MILLVVLFVGIKRAVVGPKLQFPRMSNDSKTFSNYARALLLVLFSFEGWENANFVRTCGLSPSAQLTIYVITGRRRDSSKQSQNFEKRLPPRCHCCRSFLYSLKHCLRKIICVGRIGVFQTEH